MRPQDPVHSPFLKRQERLVARVKNTYRFSLGDQFLGFARATYPLSFYWIISFLLPVQVWIRKCLHFCFYIDLTWTALCVNWTCFCYCLQRANESFVWFRGFSAFHRFLWILRRGLRTQADVRLAFCQCSALARRVGGVFEQLHLLISVLLPDFGVLWTFSWRWASVLVAVSFYQHDPSFARVYSFCRSLVPCFEILPSFSRRNRRFSVAQPSVRRRRTLWCVAYSVRVCVCVVRQQRFITVSIWIQPKRSRTRPTSVLSGGTTTSRRERPTPTLKPRCRRRWSTTATRQHWRSSTSWARGIWRTNWWAHTSAGNSLI